MEPAEPEAVAEPRAVLAALGRAQDWLEALGRRQAGAAGRARRSLERALLAVLWQEQRVRVQAQAERGRLRRDLAALQAANDRVARAGAAEAAELARGLAALSAGVQAQAEALLPAALCQEAGALLGRAMGLSLRFTTARFAPRQAAPVLGELLCEEEVLGVAEGEAEAAAAGSPEPPRDPQPGLTAEEPAAEPDRAPASPYAGPEPPREAPGSPWVRDALVWAQAVLVPEGDSDSAEEPERPGAVPDPRPPAPAVAPEALPRWASADCLGRPGAAVPALLSRSCLELPGQGERRARPLSPSSSALAGGRGAGGNLEGPRGLGPAVPGTPRPRRAAPGRAAGEPGPVADRLLGQLGQYGKGRGGLDLPHGVHAGPGGTLYVVDYGNRRVQVVEAGGGPWRQVPLRGRAYFDVAVSARGLLALTNTGERAVELYSPQGALLQALALPAGAAPRGIAAGPCGEFLVADTKQGALLRLALGRAAGRRLELRGTVPGFDKPYLVAASARGQVAVSERGLDGGCCVKVLGTDLQVLRVLGARGGPRGGPLLSSPWGVCLDEAGTVLVADWGREAHSVLCYPATGPGRAVVTRGLSSPRGLALLGARRLVVVDSMHNCLKVFQYR